MNKNEILLDSHFVGVIALCRLNVYLYDSSVQVAAPSTAHRRQGQGCKLMYKLTCMTPLCCTSPHQGCSSVHFP